MKNIIRRIALCLGLLAVMSACEHKELCFDHFHKVTLRLEFDWTDAPDADPDGMCVWFYPVDSPLTAPQRFDFQGREGGEIELPMGRYHIICYNNDTESTLFNYTDVFDTHHAYTREGHILEPILGPAAINAPRAKGTEDERVVICPDMMWGTPATDVNVAATGVSYVHGVWSPDLEISKPTTENTEYVITLYPHELICTYTYEIRNVKGLDRISQMSGSLSSMSPALTFSTEALHTECVTLPFEAQKYDEKTIVGKFYTFGHHEDNAEPHRMLIYAWLNDGTKLYFGQNDAKFDVTDQVHSAPDKRHVHLIIDGLDVPENLETLPDYDASIDDWHDVYVDIEM